VRDTFDRALRANGHERRCLHDAMSRAQLSTPGRAVTSEDGEGEVAVIAQRPQDTSAHAAGISQ
jgi:hypothetical protein